MIAKIIMQEIIILIFLRTIILRISTSIRSNFWSLKNMLRILLIIHNKIIMWIIITVILSRVCSSHLIIPVLCRFRGILNRYYRKILQRILILFLMKIVWVERKLSISNRFRYKLIKNYLIPIIVVVVVVMKNVVLKFRIKFDIYFI